MTMRTTWEKINKECGKMIFNLYERWLCEKDYEDINDYLEVIKNVIPEAVKMTKRPFGFVCNCEDGILTVQIKRNGNYANLAGSFKRI